MDLPPPPPAALSFSEDLKSYSGDVTDVGQGVQDFLWRRHPVHSFFAFLIPICLSISIAYVEFFSRYSPHLSGDGVQGAIFLSLLPLVIPFSSYWRVSGRMQKLFYTELAKILGCTYSPIGGVPVKGQLFSFGHSGTVRNQLSGIYKNVPLRLADYFYVEGSGKNQHTYHYIIGELSVGGALPHILCKPEGWSLEILDAWKPSGYKQLSLEGNFNTKFIVYVPEDKEMEALQVLEPNVMAKLMDGFEAYGFECIDSRVYLFKKGEMRENRESVIALYTLLTRFCDVLLPELQTFLRDAQIETNPL